MQHLVNLYFCMRGVKKGHDSTVDKQHNYLELQVSSM